MEKRIEIYDSTLRSSTLTRELVYTLEDKIKIIKILDTLGVSFVEVGDLDHWPHDPNYFKRLHRLRLENAQLVVRGTTRSRNRLFSEDPRFKALLAAETGVIAIRGESWDLLVREEKHSTLEENLRMIGDTVTYLKRGGKMVIYVADHFFDGYKNNHSYARDTLRAASEAGADRIVLSEVGCGCFPHEVFGIFESVKQEIKGRLGIESQNDMGCAVANSVAAVRSGAIQVHGTFLGVGEGCGNTALCTLIPNLQLRMGLSCIKSSMVQELTRTAVYMAELCNLNIPSTTPYIGRDAFDSSHVYPLGVLPVTGSGFYGVVTPEMVGNSKAFSGLANKAVILEKLGKVNSLITREQLQSKELQDLYAQRELMGYHYDSAEASLMLLVLEHFERFIPPYEILSLRILDEQPRAKDCENAMAYLKLRMEGETVVVAQEGEGVIAAIWAVMSKALCPYFPEVAKLKITNYRIRLTESDRKAPRVSLDVTDGKVSWSTVGVSVDLVSAIFAAVKDAFDFALVRKELMG